jgi:Ethanolamine utilization protein EutJ (predicted chaperonin)
VTSVKGKTVTHHLPDIHELDWGVINAEVLNVKDGIRDSFVQSIIRRVSEEIEKQLADTFTSTTTVKDPNDILTADPTPEHYGQW